MESAEAWSTPPSMTAITGALPTGIIISQQEPGTVIRDPRTGEELTVTDTNAVNMGRTIYVTPRTYAAIKAECERRALTPPENPQ